MAVLVTVKAIADFPHHDRLVRAGELVSMRAEEAAAAARRRLVSLTRPRQAAVEAPPRQPAAVPDVRRRYRRRDLQPEP